MDETSRKRARAIADRHLADGDPLGWFDEVYTAAEENLAAIPWADARPNANLLHWLDNHEAAGERSRALVVGCGLGDDAEELARRGFAVTAFDISSASINWCQKRFPQSCVAYRVADLFDAPPEWERAFDFIFEAYTLQSLPADLRPSAMHAVARFLAPGGALLVVARGREPHEPDTGPPWPLTRTELDTFTTHGLRCLEFEDGMDGETPPMRRFRMVYRMPGKRD
jgi:SAM-dependent methyltransferase